MDIDETGMEDSQQQRAPRAGRRARQGFEAQQDSLDASPPPAVTFSPDSSTTPAAFIDENQTQTKIAAEPPPTRSQVAFAEEPSESKQFTGVSRRKQEQLKKGDEVTPEAINKKKYEEKEVDDGMMEIPELEEEGQEDITRQVADAPKVRAQRVQDLSELEGASQFNLPETDDRDIDLSLLTSCLCSLEQVQEPDEVWEPEQLFAQLASELHAEEDKMDAKNNTAAMEVDTAIVGFG